MFVKEKKIQTHRGSKMEKEVIEGAVKICEPIQMKMLDPCFEPWIEHYYKKWKSKELILYNSVTSGDSEQRM